MAVGSCCTLLATLLLSFARLGQSQTCTGQSCIIAAVSGSSGEPFTSNVEPTFPQEHMECCIIHYNPSVAQRLYSLVPGLEASCPTASYIQYPNPPDLSNVECKPKVMIFACGTSQSTEGGGPLGIQLQSVLGDEWHVQGVNYTPDNDGNLCLAIPGGITGSEILAAYSTRCPNSALFVGGYSQGAEVAHNTVANSTHADRVNAVLTFGDPFNGAPIKGYSGPIHTICNPGDLVCSGLPIVLPAHLEYGLRINEAANYLNSVQVSSSGSSAGSSAMTKAASSAMTKAASSAPASSAVLASFKSVITTAPDAFSATMRVGGAGPASSAIAAASSLTAKFSSSAAAASSSAAAASASAASGNGSTGSVQVGAGTIGALAVTLAVTIMGMFI